MAWLWHLKKLNLENLIAKPQLYVKLQNKMSFYKLYLPSLKKSHLMEIPKK